MRKVFKCVFLLLALCSCDFGDVGIYPKGSFDRGIWRIRHYARDIFPDSLMLFFPKIDNRDTSIRLLGTKENMFCSFPLVKKSELNNLPWLFGELYQISNESKYQMAIDSLLLNHKRTSINSQGMYSFKQLCSLENYSKDWPVDKDGVPLFVAEIDTLMIKGETVILAHQRNMGLEENDFRLKYDKSCSPQGEHGYSYGVTYSKSEIYYWVIAW